MSSPTPPSDNTGDAVEAPAEVGEETAVDANQETLLNRLLYRGVLPRYAFPTDVATFYVFDLNKSTPFRPAYRFSPSQSLTVALSQYAPGKEVWIASKRFVSGAIFSPIHEDRYKAWQEKRLYYECKNCRFACTRPLSSGQRGEVTDCPACGKEGAFGPARFWFRPPGFAHPVSVAENVTPDELPPKSYATRAKLDAPTPGGKHGAWVHIGERIRAHYFRQQLLVTNTGPKQDGYTYCTLCGRIEPTSPPTGDLNREHPKPYPDIKKPTCPGHRATSGVCLGTDFITDILLVTLRVEAPVRLTPGVLATEIALRTVSEALAKATCVILELEDGEVQADFRAALTDGGQSGLEAEVYLYDTLPGGAGFARRAGERLNEVLERAIDILEQCGCDSSCYECLRSFKNKFEHDRLDRHLGRDLLQYVLNGQPLALNVNREDRAVTLLAEDLRRQSDELVSVEQSIEMQVAGLGTVTAPIRVQAGGREIVICITHPLTPQVPSVKELEEMKEYSSIPVITQSELTVRRNLPTATQAVLAACGIK